LIELGCGPGFYSSRLAQRYPEISVIGVDRSPSQLSWAREKRNALRLNNCQFQSDNVLELSHGDDSFDVLIASRLFTVLPNRRRAVAEMYRVLRPGGLAIHVLPTHTWRFWTTLTLIPAGFQYIFAGPGAIAAWPSAATKQSKSLWYKLKRFLGRHGEHGNMLSEHWLFHPIRWRRTFRRDGFEIIEERPVGIFHTGNMLLGKRLTIDRRKRLGQILGSACRLYVLRSVER